MRVNETINPIQLIRDTFDNLNRIVGQRSQRSGDHLAFTKEVAQHGRIPAHTTLIGLVNNVGSTLASLRPRSELVLLVGHYQSVTRPE